MSNKRLLQFYFLTVCFSANIVLSHNSVESISVENDSKVIRVSDIDKLGALGQYLAIYEDKKSLMTIDEIKDLRPDLWVDGTSEIPSLGYSKNAFWVHLTLNNNVNQSSNLLLSIENSNLDDVQFYIFAKSKEKRFTQSGDHYPFDHRERINRFFVSPITIDKNEYLDIYLRIKNMGSLQFPIYLEKEKKYALDLQYSSLLWGIYFGLTLIMALYNLVLFFSVKDKSYLLFSLFIFSNIFFHACLQGFGFQFLWPNSESINGWAMHVSNSFLYVFGGLFISEFTNLEKLSKLQYRVMITIVVVAFVSAIASHWSSYQINVMIMTSLAFPFAFTSVAASFTSLLKGNKAARFFLVSWVIFMSAAFILAANKMGLIPRNFLTENGLQIGNALSILFISLALADNINIEKKKRMALDEETLRLEREARASKEQHLEMQLQNKEAELSTQQKIITAREEVLLAKAQSKTKSNFLATMSHEIRTPLNGILGMSEMLKDTSLSKKQQDILDIISSSGRSLLNLINDILDFSKIEAGKMEMEYRVFDFHQLHHDVIKNFQLIAKEKSIQLMCKIDKSVPRFVESDSNRIQQVLFNLIGNAIKFTEMGSIQLNVSCRSQNLDEGNQRIYLKTEVIDSGIGLTSEQQEKLFRSFSQADGSTTRKYGGTGLGLSISKKIIELLDGEIGVISEKNNGATFWFEVPSKIFTEKEVSKLNDKHDENLRENQHLEIKDQLTGFNVLVAEDNKVNQLVIKGMLTKLGLNCFIAENGEEALEHVTHYFHDIDAILMDCEMPVMDGYSASKAIRVWENENDKESLPIIAVTAHAMESMIEDSINAGMDEHISKPVEMQRLSEILAKYLL